MPMIVAIGGMKQVPNVQHQIQRQQPVNLVEMVVSLVDQVIVSILKMSAIVFLIV